MVKYVKNYIIFFIMVLKQYFSLIIKTVQILSEKTLSVWDVVKKTERRRKVEEL